MNISVGALKRPIFFTSIAILIFLTGLISLRNMAVDLMPKLDIPFVVVMVPYPGAGPKEVETVVTVPLEEELVSLEGLKKMTSMSQDSFSQITLEFNMGLSPDTIEQKVRDRIALVKTRFPKAVQEASVQKYDSASLSILTLAIHSSKLNRIQLTDWVERDLKPQIAQIPKVGKLDILGGIKREIHVVLDAKKLELYRMPIVSVSDEIARSGENSPGGVVRKGGLEVGVRNLGEYSSLETLRNRVVSFSGGEYPVRVSSLGDVIDASEKESTRAFYKNEPALIVDIFKQGGANVIQITDLLKERIEEISQNLKAQDSDIKIEVVIDGAKEIRDNVWDVQESIILGIFLTILVVYLFLASLRSTLITGLAIPNSIVGAFVLMNLMGFSINIMTLLALSLTVGLLVDDAIVVRENIFKHLEAGKSAVQAALDGVREVSLPVIATTVAIMAVFGPVAFISGMIGQFFREFGLTVVFAMLISLFDALVLAPILSAYWAGTNHGAQGGNLFLRKIGRPFSAAAKGFGKMQDRLEIRYKSFLEKILKLPKVSGAVGFGFSLSLFLILPMLPATFMPEAESTSLNITVTLPSGTPLDEGEIVLRKIKKFVDENPGVRDSVLTVGSANRESNVISARINLKAPSERKQKASQITEDFRAEVEKLKKDLPENSETRIGKGTEGGFPIVFSVLGSDRQQTSEYAKKLSQRLSNSKSMVDIHTTEKRGRPEMTVRIKPEQAGKFGISEALVGNEIRGRIEGVLSGRFRERGREYDIRVKLKEGAETFLSQLNNVLVPNLNMTPVRLTDVAVITEGESPAMLERINRASSVTINAGLKRGSGIGEATAELKEIMAKELVPPPGVRLKFEGEAEEFAEMGAGFGIAMGFGLVLLYLVLSSLYESFLIPFLVMTAIPLAIGGAFVALLFAGQGIDMYSLIGVLLLMGVATKNSILMVDTVIEHLKQESDIDFKRYSTIILDSCVRRLRPIIMTSMALIAGMIPIAIGLNEASAQRTSMGTAVIGGTISSTVLTLVLLPILLILVRNQILRVARSSGSRNRSVDLALAEAQMEKQGGNHK